MLWLIHVVKSWAGDYCWFKTWIMYIFIACAITVVITLSLDYNPHAFPYLIRWQMSLKLGISTFEVVMAVLRKSPFSRMWPHVMWYTFTDPTEERTVSVFSTDGKGSSSWSSKIVSEIMLDQMAALPWILYLHHFLCLHFSDVPFSVTHCPVSSDAQVSDFWLTDQHLISDIKRTLLFLNVFK
jgi:hypothetical protein